ncbi:MAG: DNA-binding response regulator [Alphaproteobacteria bacterium]|nr:DNA-binding response regulator [Alphaproteobacteria bacterium]
MNSETLLIAYETEVFGNEFCLHMENHFSNITIASSIAETIELTNNQIFDAIIAEDKIAFASDEDSHGNKNLRPSLRKNGIKTPLIIIGDKSNIERHFNNNNKSDTDKFITKPFNLVKLINVVKAIISAHEESEHAEFSIGSYTLQQSLKRLFNPENGDEITLTEKEISILQYLCKANGKSVDKDTLLHEVWGYHPDITTHTLETHIYRLRQKMGSHSRHITTEQDGYKLAL